MDEEHCKKVAARKSRFLENLRNTRQKSGGCFYLLKKDVFTKLCKYSVFTYLDHDSILKYCNSSNGPNCFPSSVQVSGDDEQLEEE